MQDSYSIQTSASPEKVWQMWTDVKNWKSWDSTLKDSSISGEFNTDVQGILVLERGPKTNFEISSCQPNFSYTVKTHLPFAEMYIKRLIGYNNHKTIIKNEVWIEGPLSTFWWRLVGKKYQKMLPQMMEKFRLLAER
jgi:hypothetical protein